MHAPPRGMLQHRRSDAHECPVDLVLAARPELGQETAAAIEGIDIHVRDARHVEAGNALLRTREDFHLVLIDLDTAGIGAVDVGRVWSARPGTNIAATRWLTSEVDLVACVKAGALGYFPKELSPRALAGAMSLVAQGMR